MENPGTITVKWFRTHVKKMKAERALAGFDSLVFFPSSTCSFSADDPFLTLPSAFEAFCVADFATLSEYEDKLLVEDVLAAPPIFVSFVSDAAFRR